MRPASGMAFEGCDNRATLGLGAIFFPDRFSTQTEVERTNIGHCRKEFCEHRARNLCPPSRWIIQPRAACTVEPLHVPKISDYIPALIHEPAVGCGAAIVAGQRLKRRLQNTDDAFLAID